MCLRPVTIPTNRLAYRQGIDKMYMTVPCGQCEECRLNKINDYYVRLHYEWERYMHNRGSVFFITLSHNNESLPFTPCTSSLDFQIVKDFLSDKGFYLEDDFANLPCFDKSAVRSFLERLHHLDRFPEKILRGMQYFCKGENGQFVAQNSCFCDNDGVARNPVLGAEIKHFIVCEYGKTTKRPHYHAILFFPFIVSAGAFKRVCEFAWSTLVPVDSVPCYIKDVAQNKFKDDINYLEFRDWFVYRTGKKRLKSYYMRKNGFVMYSVKGAQMTRPLGMKYLCKYLFKDTEFLKIPFIPEYIDIVKELPALDTFKESEIKRSLKRYKDSVPFFLISNGVGTMFEQEVKCESLEDAREFAKRQFTFEHDEHIYSMPKYFIRRLLYQNTHYVKIDDDFKHVTLCYLTEFGRNVLKAKFEDTVARYIDKVRLVSTSAFKSLLYPLDFEFGNRSCEVPFDLQNFYDTLYNDFLSLPKLRALAYYKYVFAGVACRKEDIFNDLSYEDVVKLGDTIFDTKLSTNNDNEHTIYAGRFIKLHRSEVDFCHWTYDSYFVFAGFREFMTQLDFIYNLVHDRQYKESAKRFEQAEKFRSIYNSIIYKNAV